MMNLKEIQAAAAALGNQLSAGVPVLAATERMARFQPAYAAFWREVAQGASAGQTLSSFLGRVWPATLVSVVRAGEESGTLPVVLERIEATVELQREMYKLMSELAYPVGFGALGLAVFVFFMVKVIPALSSSLGVGNHGFVFELSTWMSGMVAQHWLGMLLGGGGLAGAAAYWLSQADNRSKVADLMLNAPVVGDALRHIAFGIWAHYMALMDATGSIPVTEGLDMTSAALPPSLREGMRRMSVEAVVRGLGDAADPDRQPDGDSRRTWPFYIGNAFLIAEETGRLDVELLRAARAMLKHGKEKLKVALWFANVIALFVSAVLIVGPLAAYYIQLGIALADAMKG
ncbi:type II secretion system F family protein [Rugamonas aquatica]|uniref:Type II secretion system protein GspF domain-containing protein n=1 Tax=Rugamonas aquatica TaxID=2743357 RepID=A0A6A7N6N4_9BURK|nr:type II secretion system F family protein [Rugamonas aquatica]MQA40764.1 hypothetical protein [Rugamonas aquatica]